MTKPAKLTKSAIQWIKNKESLGQLAPMNECGCEVATVDKQDKKQRKTKKEHGCSSYRWYSGLKKRMNTSRPTQWFEEAENEGILKGKGECAKRLRKLAKQDRRKFKKATEKREDVREQLKEDLWKYGMAGLSQAGKPRGVKKPNAALPENPPLSS
jgi:hypothetical protein